MITGTSMQEIFFTKVMIDDLRSQPDEQEFENQTKQSRPNQFMLGLRRSLGRGLKGLGNRLDPQTQTV